MTNLNTPSICAGPLDESCIGCGQRRMPAGCDQQGRYAPRAPAPAEACTDIGADADCAPATWGDLIWLAAGALGGLAAFAALAGYVFGRLN